MSEPDGDERQAAFARLLASVENPPSDGAIALGHMMRDWLQSAMADSGTSVDTGGGIGCYDLWVKFGGKELAIQIRETGR